MNKKYSRKTTTTRTKKGRRLLQVGVSTIGRTRLRPAVTTTLPESILKAHRSGAATLTHATKREAVSSADASSKPFVETSSKKTEQPEEVRTYKRTGKSVGGRVKRRKKPTPVHFIPPMLDSRSEQTNIHNTNLTSRTIERPSQTPQLDPIRLNYVVEQVGDSKQLDMYKTMYPRVPLKIYQFSQKVGGSLTTNSQNLLTGETFCGLNRANVHWPTAYYDWTEPIIDNRLAPDHSLFNRNQIVELLRNLWIRATEQDPNNPPSMSFDDWWQKVTNTIGGDQSYGFPVSELEVIFEYQNRNTATDMHLSIYMCTPKRILNANQTPMTDWFNPFQGIDATPLKNNSMLMNPGYRYDPLIMSEPEVMGTSDNAGAGTNTTNPNANPITIYANRTRVQTASTEVCLDATPFLSAEFKRNWKVVTVQKVKLAPQQTLFYKMRLDFSKIINMKEFFAEGAQGNNEHPFFFPDMTIFPLIKYWGSEVTGESKDLLAQQGLGPYKAGRNLAQESTGPRTGACALSCHMSCNAVIHAKQVPLYMPTGTPSNQALLERNWLELLMDNFTTKSRELFDYNDPQRGVDGPYHTVNENLLDFYNKSTWSDPSTLTAKEYGTSLVELNTHAGTIPTTGEPVASQLLWSATTDIAYNSVETVSKQRIVTTQSDINPAG